MIARAFFGRDREVAASVSLGASKSTLASLLALHHVLSVENASVYVGAASLDQARIIGGVVQRYARHPAIAHLLTPRHNEVRLGDRRGPTVLQIVSSDGERAHG